MSNRIRDFADHFRWPNFHFGALFSVNPDVLPTAQLLLQEIFPS